jgi:hypothetical protein
MAKQTTKTAKPKPRRTGPRCGLCGKPAPLMRTACCDQWICDDHHKYQLFSMARNSCHRNHARYTLCGYHHVEGHAGNWQTCEQCRTSFETEMYVWYGTNEFNFEKLQDPPAFEPTKCAGCGKVIRLGTESHLMSGDDYFCMKCANVPKVAK